MQERMPLWLYTHKDKDSCQVMTRIPLLGSHIDVAKPSQAEGEIEEEALLVTPLLLFFFSLNFRHHTPVEPQGQE